MLTVQARDARLPSEANSALTGELTEREQLQQELERMASLALSDPNLILECAADGSILFVNDAARTLARSLGKPDPRDLLPTDLQPLLGTCLASGRDIRNYESTFATDRTLDWTLRPMTAAQTVYLYGTEITARKLAEKQLQDSQERLRFALEHTQVGQWVINLKTDTACRSSRYDQIFGYEAPATEWGYTIFLNKHVHPEDRTEVDESFKVALARATEWEFECRIIRTDQEMRWIWARGTFALGEDGRPRWMSGVIMDITDRKRKEEALWKSVERYRNPSEGAARSRSQPPAPRRGANKSGVLAEHGKPQDREARLRKLSRAIEHSPVCVIIANAEGTIEYVNCRYAQMTGYCAELVLGQNLAKLRPAACSAELEARIRATIQGGREWRGEMRWQRKNGNTCWGAVRIAPLRDHQGHISHFVTTLQDITARKAAETPIEYIISF